MFYLGYHLHWSHDEVMALSPCERRHYLELLVEESERQEREIQANRRRFGAA